MNSRQFRALLDLMMCSDPWPVGRDGERNEQLVKSIVDEEAQSRGFNGWVEAYHQFTVSDADREAHWEEHNVKSARYHTETGELIVGFANGGVYRYIGIPEELGDAFLNSIQPGTFLNQHIRGAFDYERLN